MTDTSKLNNKKISKLLFDTPGIYTTMAMPKRICAFCGKEEELRPYGPKGENICFDCMKKDEPAAQQQSLKRFE